jgi:hydroxyacylglutathione hydrolase
MTLRTRIVPVTVMEQNCTLLWDDTTGSAVVIDPGGDIPRILAALRAENLAPEAIWLTHGHLDHAGGAEALRTALGGIPLLGPHQADATLLAAIPDQAAMFGVTGFDAANPDRFLTDGEILPLGNHRFTVRHTPGHAPGHVVFLDEEARFGHVGDVLFRGSIGRTDLPGGHHATLLESIARVLLTLPDDFTFICGHGPGSTIGAERRSNPFLQ